MTGSLGFILHWWRGIGPDVEPDLFFWRWRVGIVTVTVCRVCVLAKYQDTKAALARATAEAARLRQTIDSAVAISEKRRRESEGG